MRRRPLPNLRSLRLSSYDIMRAYGRREQQLCLCAVNRESRQLCKEFSDVSMAAERALGILPRSYHWSHHRQQPSYHYARSGEPAAGRGVVAGRVARVLGLQLCGADCMVVHSASRRKGVSEMPYHTALVIACGLASLSVPIAVNLAARTTITIAASLRAPTFMVRAAAERSGCALIPWLRNKG